MYNNVGTQPGVPRPPVNAANAPPNPFGMHFMELVLGLSEVDSVHMERKF